MQFSCPNCQHQLRGDNRLAGKSVKCPKCEHPFTFPGQANKPSAPQPDIVTATVVPPRSYGDKSYPQTPENTRETDIETRAKPWIVTCIVAIGIMALVFFFVIYSFASYILRTGNDLNAKADAPQAVQEDYTTPDFPELGQSVSHGQANVYSINLGSQLKSWSSDQPAGNRTQIRVYVPQQLKPNEKAACILVAPAGSNLLHGKQLDDLSYTDEVMPYVDAGMIVVEFSQDGNGIEQATTERQELQMLPGCFKEFSKANGGVINGQVALDFALKKFEQIDSERIYCAGHSSAGTISLQLASTDERITRCIAYAPAPSLTKRFAEVLGDASANQLLPGLRDYVNNWSPDKRISKFHCPIFIFQARDDNNTPYRDAKQFCDMLEAADKDVELVTTPRGGHYQSMIDEGIPAAIQWLQRK